MITKTKEDYLRAIYHIQEEKQGSKAGVKSIDVYKYLNISKSSISEMLRKLTKEELIHPISYKKIRLTKKGLSEAINITKRHRIIETFLSKILKISHNLIHDEAHRLEHSFSNESINSITKLIKNAKSCPHGKPIP